MKPNFYYYNPETGEFKYRTSVLNPLIDLPYIEKNEGWQYSDYRVDVPYSTLIYQPMNRPTNPRMR